MKHEIILQLRCHTFPGRHFDRFTNLHLGVQRKQEIVEETPGDASYKVFDLPVFFGENKDGVPDFKGEFVHGRPGERFLYLVWFDKNRMKKSCSGGQKSVWNTSRKQRYKLP